MLLLGKPLRSLGFFGFQFSIELSVNGTVVDSQTVQLAPQQSKEVLLSFKASKEGPGTVAVGNIEQTIMVTAEQAAELRQLFSSNEEIHAVPNVESSESR